MGKFRGHSSAPHNLLSRRSGGTQVWEVVGAAAHNPGQVNAYRRCSAHPNLEHFFEFRCSFPIGVHVTPVIQLPPATHLQASAQPQPSSFCPSLLYHCTHLAAMHATALPARQACRTKNLRGSCTRSYPATLNAALVSPLKSGHSSLQFNIPSFFKLLRTHHTATPNHIAHSTPPLAVCYPLGKVIYSLDKAKQHLATLRSLEAGEKNEPPAHSPDIHKVIEHPLSAFNRAWYPEFTMDTRCTSCNTAMAKASEILRRTSADSIWKDIQTLPDTLRSVLHNGGDWADVGLC